MKTQNQNGYVLLLAVLISSIILAMSLGVFAIALKEVSLATFARDSVRAFAAASRGLECAMFYDRITTHNTLDAGLGQNFYIARSPMQYTPFQRGVQGVGTEFENYVNVDNGNAPEPERWKLDGTTGAPFAGFLCAGQTPSGYTTQADSPATGNAFIDSHSGTSAFSIDYGDSCATVTVVKRGVLTTFSSSGFSSPCSDTNPRRTQRVIEVAVNI